MRFTGLLGLLEADAVLSLAVVCMFTGLLDSLITQLGNIYLKSGSWVILVQITLTKGRIFIRKVKRLVKDEVYDRYNSLGNEYRY